MRFAAVLLLLYCTVRVFSKFTSLGWDRPDRLQDGTQTHKYAYTHGGTVRGCDKATALKLWLPRRINTVEHDWVHSNRRQHSNEKLVCIASPFVVLLP